MTPHGDNVLYQAIGGRKMVCTEIRDILGNSIKVSEIYHLCIRDEVCGFILLAWTKNGNKVLSCHDDELVIQENYQAVKSMMIS